MQRLGYTNTWRRVDWGNAISEVMPAAAARIARHHTNMARRFRPMFEGLAMGGPPPPAFRRRKSTRGMGSMIL